MITLSAFCYGLGYLTGAVAFGWMARRRGFQPSSIWLILQIALVAGLMGANAAQLLLGGTAGKSVLGGIVGGWLGVAIAKRFLGIRRPTGDLFAVALCAGEAVGRLGCLFGGCCYGKASDLPWHIWQHGAYRHPTQLYLSVACLLILSVLLVVERSRPPANTLIYSQGALYCLGRFIVEFFRDGAPSWNGLTIAQWACMFGGLFFGFRLAALARRTVRELEPPPIIGSALEGAR
jgi:Prolipoprotein diacylglyceryltransferase